MRLNGDDWEERERQRRWEEIKFLKALIVCLPFCFLFLACLLVQFAYGLLTFAGFSSLAARILSICIIAGGFLLSAL